MIRREKIRKKTIKELSDKVYDKILSLDEGTEISVSEIVDKLYEEQGYKCIYLNSRYGWVWTKDDGATFSIKDDEQFEILDIVENKLQGQITLDFSKYKGMYVGSSYNLQFTVRKNKI